MGPRALLLALVVLGALAFTASASGRDLERKRHDKKRPWFCHGRDCPRFKEVSEGAAGLGVQGVEPRAGWLVVDWLGGPRGCNAPSRHASLAHQGTAAPGAALPTPALTAQTRPYPQPPPLTPHPCSPLLQTAQVPGPLLTAPPRALHLVPSQNTPAPRTHPVQLKRWGPFSLRRYERSTWAAACTHDAPYEEGVWRASAALAKYLHGCNKQGRHTSRDTCWLLGPALAVGGRRAWQYPPTACTCTAATRRVPRIGTTLIHVL